MNEPTIHEIIDEIEADAYATVEPQVKADNYGAINLELSRSILFAYAGYLEDKFLDPSTDNNTRTLARIELAGHS